MWRARRAGGAECQGSQGSRGSGADADAEMEVDNLAAGGFFGWMGRELELGPGRVMARAFPAPVAALLRALEA